LTVLASSSTPAAGQVVTGVLGFLVVAGMGVALFFLLRSMNKHLRRVVREPRWREEAGGQEPGGPGPEPGGPEPGGGEDGEDGPQGQPEPGYSRNGSSQA
jgi:hypothetical protein